MKPFLATLACDVVLFVGFLSLVYGLWMAWRPLGFIVGGLLLGAAAFFFHYDAARGKR